MANLETSALTFRTDLMNMIKNIVWKNHYEASKYEQYVSSTAADEYTWAAQRLMEIYSSNQLKQIIEYDDSKFNALMDTVEDVYKRPLFLIRDYTEMNDYYRKLNGQPPLHYDEFISNNDYGIKLKDVGLTPDIIMRLHIEDIYETAYLHDLTQAQLTFLESLGYLRRLMTLHDGDGHYEYLQYMTSKKIFPFVSRIADKFDLLYVPKTSLPNLAEDFSVIYEKSKFFMIQRYYTDAYRNKYEFYEGFVGLAILFMTIQQLNVMYLDTDITREFYDLDSIRVVYQAYSVPFYEDIPVAYHAKIVKAINRLLTYKGSNHIIFDLAALFDFGKLTIFQYYLMKQQNINTDGTPHYIFDPVYDENGEYLYSEINYEKTYDIHFVKRALGQESPFEAINNPNNDLDYQSVILEDPYWLDDADLREKMYHNEYNFIETKYLGLMTQISVTKFMYESVYFMRMLFDNREIFEKHYIHNTKIGEDVDIFTTIIYLHALICKKLGWTEDFNKHSVPGVNYIENSGRCVSCYGAIPTEPTKIAKLMGFNFKADLQKIMYDCMVMDSRHTISFLDSNKNGWYFYPKPIRKGSKWTGMDVLVYEMRDGVIYHLVGTLYDFTPSSDVISRLMLEVIEHQIPADITSKYKAGVFATEDEYALVFTEVTPLSSTHESLDYLLYNESEAVLEYMFKNNLTGDILDIFHDPVSITPYTAYKIDVEQMYALIFEPVNYDVHSATNNDDPAQTLELRSLGFGLNFMAKEIIMQFLAQILGYNGLEIIDAFNKYYMKVQDASIDMFDNSFDKVHFIELLSAIDLESATSVNAALGITSTYRGIIAIKEYIEKRMFAVKNIDAFHAYKHLYKVLMTCDVLPEIITKKAIKREVVYDTDENGEIVYEINNEGESVPKVLEYRKVVAYEKDENGNVVTDDEGNPVPKRDSLGNIEYEHDLATSYADLLEDLNYGLAVRLMGIDTAYDLTMEIDYILVEIQRLCEDLTFIAAYGTSNMEVIVEYLYKLIKFFKSVKAQFLDFTVIYVIDSRTDNLLKLISELCIGEKHTSINTEKSLAIGTFDIIEKIFELHIFDDAAITRDTLLQFMMLIHLRSLVFKKDDITYAELKKILESYLTLFENIDRAKKLTAIARSMEDILNEMKLFDLMTGDRRARLQSVCFKLDEFYKLTTDAILDYAGEIRFSDKIFAFEETRLNDHRFSMDSDVEHNTMRVGPSDLSHLKWWGYMLYGNEYLDLFHDLSDAETAGVISTEDDHALTFEKWTDDEYDGEEMIYEEDQKLRDYIESGANNPDDPGEYLDIFRLPSDGSGIGVISAEDDNALYFFDREPPAPYEDLGLHDGISRRCTEYDYYTHSMITFYTILPESGTINLYDYLDGSSEGLGVRHILRDRMNLTDSLTLDSYKIRYPDYGFAVPDPNLAENQVAVLTTEDEEIISDTATNYYGNWPEGTPFERRE